MCGIHTRSIFVLKLKTVKEVSTLFNSTLKRNFHEIRIEINSNLFEYYFI